MNIAVIKLRGVSTNKKYYMFCRHQSYQERIINTLLWAILHHFQSSFKLLNTSLTSVFQALFTFIFNRFDLIPRRSFWRLITSIDLKCIWRRLVCGLL